MPRTEKLSPDELQAALQTLESWSLDQGKLYREFKFKDFVQAFAFMTQVAPIAEEMDHHPEWFNVYNTLRVHLTTHDSGGITQLDLDLARRMNQIQARI